jgi:CheY-like chemotaxis protein
MASVVSATNAEAAFSLVRRYRFDVAILDMSMDTNDPLDRSNLPLENYLKERPEGTLSIVLSQVLEMAAREVRDHFAAMNVWAVEFKQDVDPAKFRETVARALSEASGALADEAEKSRHLILPDIDAEQRFLSVLRPKGGMVGAFRVIDNFLPAVSPLRAHLHRPSLSYGEGCGMLLAWSRMRGCAVTILMTASSMPPDDAKRQLSRWLGYEPKGEPFLRREPSGIHLMCWDDPEMDDAHFDLPKVSPS